jgi:hypothetical protein
LTEGRGPAFTEGRGPRFIDEWELLYPPLLPELKLLLEDEDEKPLDPLAPDELKPPPPLEPPPLEPPPPLAITLPPVSIYLINALFLSQSIILQIKKTFNSILSTSLNLNNFSD